MTPPRTPEKWKGDGLGPARPQPVDPATAYHSGLQVARLLIITYGVLMASLMALVLIGRLDGDQLISAMKYLAVACGAQALAAQPGWLSKLLAKSYRRQLRKHLPKSGRPRHRKEGR